MAKCRNAEQNDRGKNSSRQGSTVKHSRPFLGKSGTQGKEQKSSTNTEKTPRDQAGRKTTHQDLPWKEKLRPHIQRVNRQGIRKYQDGEPGDEAKACGKIFVTARLMTKFRQQGDFAPICQLG
jgi:hypothetical protein